MAELVGLEELAELIEPEELVELSGGRVSRTARGEKAGGPNQVGRVGRARGEKETDLSLLTELESKLKVEYLRLKFSGVVEKL